MTVLSEAEHLKKSIMSCYRVRGNKNKISNDLFKRWEGEKRVMR